ncbi:MarR family winged helix-turn-helix transcriptional regulator [Mechercharimyces sp. CAU 1602]|uniref:MarR family winged helix-turn-helix transcriptional regulator n=1 Tax=Mechercharimyces sp. CAU 1602 TaxID=2973933 RepID=UPI002161F5B6|nr:MarR family transcriptional regulator [Mechercharimyces sp. CAU 1602]MCS1350392.1 MarR family transcriptional regulator [Mechercharimyces sp. CAU 1602]
MNRKQTFTQFIALSSEVNQLSIDLCRGSEHQFTTCQYNLLKYLKFNQPVAVSEICDYLKISLPNASRELKKLQEQDLIQKNPSREDRRKVYINLSEKGDRLVTDYFTALETQFLDRIKGISEDDIEEINQALAVLLSKLF